jgi:hypothetical protein
VPDRARGLAIFLALAFCLVAGSTPRIVGDGGEYLVQAMNFASFNRPSLGRRAILEIEPQIHAIEPALSEWSIEKATVPAADRRRDFLHFWFYALVATPALWGVNAVGASPVYAFTITNIALLALAFWVLLPRIGWALTLLLLGSPLVWWIDKPHTEPFTVALLAIAFALARDRPGVALVAAGAAATQNLPVAIVYLLLAGVTFVESRGAVLQNRAWLAGAAIGAMLVLLHPIYTYARHGTPSLLLYATRPGFPTFTELGAVLWDPTIGLVGNAPFLIAGLTAAAFVALRGGARGLFSAEFGIAVIAAALFLYSAAQTSNTHHGATPSLSRYALWLLPLAVPLLQAARRQSGSAGRAVLLLIALVSSATSVFAFHPRVGQLSREPTWMATGLWTRHPTWQNPLPEVFSEVMLGVEGTTVPAATARCEKILIASGEPIDGTWPVPCYPADLEAQCRVRDAFCYANRTDRTYQFARAPGRELSAIHDRQAAWPEAAEPHVRAIYDSWDWWALSSAPAAISALRASVDVQAAEFGDDTKFLVVMRRRGPNAHIRLRPTNARLAGRMYDPLTGDRLGELVFAGAPLDVWDIEMPAGKDFVIVGLTSGDVPQ